MKRIFAVLVVAILSGCASTMVPGVHETSPSQQSTELSIKNFPRNLAGRWRGYSVFSEYGSTLSLTNIQAVNEWGDFTAVLSIYDGNNMPVGMCHPIVRQPVKVRVSLTEVVIGTDDKRCGSMRLVFRPGKRGHFLEMYYSYHQQEFYLDPVDPPSISFSLPFPSR